jgi:hypothetical protein
MKVILFFVMLCLGSITYSQNEFLNQFDSNGKKHGKWIVWLDKNWKLAKDSMSADYFRYNYFNHGNSCNPMGPWGGKGNRLEGQANPVKKGNAVMLSGEYKWYNSKGELISEHVLKDGWYVSFKEYFPSTGKLQTFFDYTQHDRGQNYIYSIETYNKKSELKYKGWAYEEYGGKGVDN